jgi:hypothetical protein
VRLARYAGPLAQPVDREGTGQLAELGYRGPAPKIEHYRSDDKLYTFRTPVFPSAARATSPEQSRVLIQHLLAYEAMFGVLGDMPGGDEE